MNICFICSEYPPASHGGVGSMTQTLGRALVANGHGVRVVGVYRNMTEAPSYEEDQGVKVWRLPRQQARLGWLGARYRVYKQVARWARDGEIDLVESPDWEGWIAGWPKLSVPLIARLHGSICYFAAEMRVPFKKSAFWLESAALRRADYWCSVSRYTADRTREVFTLEDDPTVIYNAVDVPASPAAATARPSRDVVFSGTLTEKKGVISLVEAWKTVAVRHPEAKLHIYGKDTSNPGKPSMRDFLVRSLPQETLPSVLFHGHVRREQLLNHLQQARVAVFPSYAEAFAMAPLESMAHGCPTIYSTRGSGPELIHDGVDGLLIDPSKPQQIADAICRVLADDSLAGQLGSAGQQKVARGFSTAQIASRNAEFYADCVERFHEASRN